MKHSSILKVIDDKVYEVVGLSSTFCLCHDESGEIEFSGFDPGSKEVFLQKKGGEKFTVCGIEEELFDQITQSRCLAPYVDTLTSGQYKMKPVSWELKGVELKELVYEFRTMQDYITVNQHMWAIEDPTVFQGQPGYEHFFQLLFTPWEDRDAVVPRLT
jgi:hypothetical protein